MVINSLVLVYESRSLSLVDMKSEGSNIYVIKNGKTCDKEFLCKKFTSGFIVFVKCSQYPKEYVSLSASIYNCWIGTEAFSNAYTILVVHWTILRLQNIHEFLVFVGKVISISYIPQENFVLDRHMVWQSPPCARLSLAERHNYEVIKKQFSLDSVNC